AEDAGLQVYVLEGIASVDVLGTSRIVPAGSFVTVPLTADGTAPAAAPASPQPYDAATVAALPVGALASAPPILPQPVAIAPPLSVEEIDQAVSDYLSGLTLEAGSYAITRVSAVARNGSENCPPNVTFTLQHDGSSDLLFGHHP